jgi:hypothetical protein
MNHAYTATVVVSLLCAARTVAAQGSEDTASRVAACAVIESTTARLECFDALAKGTSAAGAATAAPRAAPPQPAASASQAESSVGAAASVPQADSTKPASRREARAAERQDLEVTGEVAAVREILPGRIEVTLTNGQVWRQTDSDRYNLLVGHEVRIYPTGFGQYFRLSSKELRRFIQVERVN